jgi:uncharacterized protein (DUF736 family)
LTWRLIRNLVLAQVVVVSTMTVLAELLTPTGAINFSYDGWIGFIRTLTIDAKVRVVPNDDRSYENSPDYRVFVGICRIGDAREATSQGENTRDCLRVRVDDPSLRKPLVAALFPSESGERARLVWSRRRE